jgi:hypothetical protein
MVRRYRLRSRWWWAAALLTLLALPVPANPATASCVGPYMFVGKVQKSTVIDPAATLSVSGRAFARGCDDTGSSSIFGCRSSQGERLTPMQDVVLLLRQGDQRWRLGVADAKSAEQNQLGRITWHVQVPAEVRTGRATLVADIRPRGSDGLDARLPVRVSRP